MPTKTKTAEDKALSNYKAKVEKDQEILTETVPANLPSSFKGLKKNELVVAAEYFGADSDGSDADIRASLEENGVTWAMYAKEFNLPGAEDLVDEEVFVEPDEVPVKEVKKEVIATAVEVETLPVDQKYLIKFIGKNPYFEQGKYKFTQDRPYAIMPAEDAQRVLEGEPTKFRQAFPRELAEFYN